MSENSAEPSAKTATTALYELHLAAGARMVSFAGYQMPVQYEGIKAEHLHTRSQAGLFDVSHMGQVLVAGETAAKELEALLPVELESLPIDQLCYTFFTLPNGGILDDMIVTRRSETEFMLVVNAACKQQDIKYLNKHLEHASLEYFEQQSLLALQGPMAEQALQALFPDIAAALAALTFMHGISIQLDTDDGAVDCYISRSGYTGEDGFEISVPDSFATTLAEGLLDQDFVKWIGLGARDSLRLEAGLCLYGHDLDTETTPVQAGLTWSIAKSRRTGGDKQAGFPGADIILSEMAAGCSRKRVGFMVDGKAPVREGAELVDAGERVVGRVCSGGFAPSLGKPIVMAYVDADFLADADRDCFAIVRGKKIAINRCTMPFVTHKYRRS